MHAAVVTRPPNNTVARTDAKTLPPWGNHFSATHLKPRYKKRVKTVGDENTAITCPGGGGGGGGNTSLLTVAGDGEGERDSVSGGEI